MCPKMGIGTSVSTAVSERTAVIIEDYMFDASTVGELKPEESPSDFHDTWDLDGTDFTPEALPDDEGYWDDFENIVLNHNYEELGSELVTSGTFSSFSKDFGDVTISGDTVSFVNTGTNPNSRVSLGSSSVAANKRYEIVFDVSRYVVGQLQIILGGTSHTVDISAGVNTYTVYLLSGSIDTDVRFKRSGGVGDFDFDLDNVSVKQVDPNDRWTLGTGWSIEDGKAVFSGTDFANLQLSSNILTIGDTYELTLTAGVTNGSFKVQHSGSSDLITESSSGTYSVIFTATATSFTIARASVGSQNDFTIDNVTVKEYAIQPKDI